MKRKFYIAAILLIPICTFILSACKRNNHNPWKDVDIDCPMGIGYEYKITNRSTVETSIEIDRTDKIALKITLKNNESYQWGRFFSYEDDLPENENVKLMPFPENKKISLYFNGKLGSVFDGDDYSPRDMRNKSNYKEIEFKREGPCPPDAMFEYVITQKDYETALSL